MADSDVHTEWSELPLDTRILEALKDLGWRKPTAVQSACVPLALKGKDISIQSRTGSGKTGAFVIPAVQHLLTEREHRGSSNAGAPSKANPSVLILVPSVELCEQTTEAANEVAKYIRPRLVVDNLTGGGAVTVNRVQSAHIVVSTAALLAKVCNQGAVTAESLRHVRFFVLDEADVVASMAERSLRTVQSLLPLNMQVVLASATLTRGVAAIKGQLLRHPVNVVLTSEDVQDNVPGRKAGAATAGAAVSQSGPVVESRIVVKDPLKTTLHQYYLVATDECHSHTLLFGLYRMALIKGKTLIFVNDDEQTYRLQNFLEQLGVATLAYDTNLPINVRLDTLKRFQSGAVSTLVCTDGTLESAVQLQMSLEESKNNDSGEAAKKTVSRRRGRSSGPRHSDEAPSALHRGIDFAHVRNVILFDGVEATDPIALSRYTHRIGRAGRAGEEGVSIAIFTVPQARKYLQPLREYCAERGEMVRPFRQMQRAAVAKLQYRVDSVLGNITRTSTRKMRVASVAAELSRSSYLANHLSQKDTEALQRVMRRSSKKVKVERNILDVPEYMKLSTVDDAGEYRKRVRSNQTQSSLLRKAAKKATADPLKAVVSKLRSSKRTR